METGNLHIMDYFIPGEDLGSKVAGTYLLEIIIYPSMNCIIP